MQHLRRSLAAAAGLAALATTASAQTTIHYWSFSTPDDLVGGLVTTTNGTPDLSVNATYGEAYPGAGASLNTILGGLGMGGGLLVADTFDTGPTALQFGTTDFAISYWVYDEDEGDVRGPRVLDCLEGTTTGIQLGTDGSNFFNLRLDDDLGAAFITNQANGGLTSAKDTWMHMVIQVDRTNDEVRVHRDGALVLTLPLGLTGDLEPTMDLQIGAINNANDGTGAQASGLDDLAFYDGLLSQAQIDGLAAGTITPLNLANGSNVFCSPANANSSGNAVTLASSDFSGPGLFHLEAEGGPDAQFGYFLVSATANPAGTPVSQGLICLGAPQGRYNGVSGANSVGQFDAGGVFQNLSGSSSVGTGFDVPPSLPSPPGGVITSGSTFHFQLWYRDGANSNFSDAVTVTFP